LQSAGLSKVWVRGNLTVQQELHYHPLPLPAPAVPGQLVIGQIPREPAAFQGRPHTAQAIEGVLTTGGIAVVCALAGGRGVGKT
jgi:DNA primase